MLLHSVVIVPCSPLIMSEDLPKSTVNSDQRPPWQPLIDDGPYAFDPLFLDEEAAKDQFVRNGYHPMESWDFMAIGE